eukprot:6051609-Pleurochrysis_carterae.AAC.3
MAGGTGDGGGGGGGGGGGRGSRGVGACRSEQGRGFANGSVGGVGARSETLARELSKCRAGALGCVGMRACMHACMHASTCDATKRARGRRE